MDINAPTMPDQRLSARYAELCEASTTLPDVFQFLKAYPQASTSDHVDVIRVDQKYRAVRGCPISLGVYLEAFPHFASDPELVRSLVDGHLAAGRLSLRRPHEQAPGMSGVPEGNDSVAATIIMQVNSTGQDTVSEQIPGPRGNSTTASFAPLDPAATQDRDLRSAAHTDDRVSFELDCSLQNLADCETIRASLDSSRFTLTRSLGVGGMGMVFEAYDRVLDEVVALKSMRRIDAQALVRFKQEFRALADITHPNLVNLYEFFAGGEIWFFTMELVDGVDILTYIRGSSACLPRTNEQGDDSSPAGEGGHLASRGRAPRTSEPGREERLRHSLHQLVEGIQALHAADKLHRDIKPTNVLVTADGRVVLLDFGLAADLEPSGQHCSTDRMIVGTLAHMSPEQASGKPVTVASDWYSVGVVLYQALTGQLPFRGSFEDMVRAKKAGQIAEPGSLVPGVPEDLSTLCMNLLARNPDARPCSARILECLRGECPRASAVESPVPKKPLLVVGRSAYRHLLDRAYGSLKEGQASTLFVFGRTGTGKTTLVRSFVEELIASDEALVLAGRCYERESVPYKALDSLIDALVRHLKTMPQRDVETLLPGDIHLLARAFPALGSVPGVLNDRGYSFSLPDPQELRIRMFAALRLLLARLGRDGRLVLLIDDLQWGDVDSAVVLADILHAPDAPLLLFLGCFRLEDSDQSRFLHVFRQAGGQGRRMQTHHELIVEPLTLADSRELALALLGRDDPTSRASAHLVARESGGNPLFIDELVKHIQGESRLHKLQVPGDLDLDEVLWIRIQGQPPEAQRLLEVVSASGRPLPLALAIQAGELGSAGRAALAAARSARLIRVMGEAHADKIDVYHDRIRETILSHISPDRLRSLHASLARVLETMGDASPEVLAHHLRACGADERSSEYYAQAAEQALRALAFDQATRLFRNALELHKGTASIRSGLERKLGDALANAGRGSESAGVYLQAAESASSSDRLELTRLASTQLLISGHVDEGLALLRTILRPLGLRMSRNPRSSLLSLIWHRVTLRIRGLAFRLRKESDVPPRELTRIDMCWSAVAGLTGIDPIHASDFQSRGLLLALRAGEPFRIARSLAMEAAHVSIVGRGTESRVDALLEQAEFILRLMDSSVTRGTILMVRGIVAIMNGRWTESEDWLARADAIFRNECTGVAWERDTVTILLLWSLMKKGELAVLADRWNQATREAEERGDLYATSTMTTFYLTSIRLAEDDPGDAEVRLGASIFKWPRREFFIQHSSAFRSQMDLDLYCGRVESAWARIQSIWPRYTRSRLLRVQMIRIQMRELYARSALALAEKEPQRPELLQAAEREARRLERELQSWSEAHSHAIRAGIAACRCDAATAVFQLSRAAELYDRADMHLNAWIMRLRMGEIRGGSQGLALVSEAEDFLRSQQIRSPKKWAQMIAPGFARIAASELETAN